LENWSWSNKEERKKERGKVNGMMMKNEIARVKEKARFGRTIFCKVFFIVVL
jgi:hypothetical protein